MAAITALTRLVQNGEEIIAGDDLYGGTVRLLEQIRQRQGIGVSYTDTTDLDAVRAALTSRTKLILIETPTNPLFRISDIRSLSQLARETGALLAVDNSILSPIFQQPRYPYLILPGPHSALPGLAFVCSPSLRTCTPLTKTCLTPTEYW